MLVDGGPLTLDLSPSSCCRSTSGTVQSVHSERSLIRSTVSSHVRRQTQQIHIFFHCWSPWHSWTSSLSSEVRKGPVHHLSCYAILLESIRYVSPNHLSHRSRIIDSEVSCPVLSHTVLFVIMSFQLIFRIFLCHLWCAASRATTVPYSETCLNTKYFSNSL